MKNLSTLYAMMLMTGCFFGSDTLSSSELSEEDIKYLKERGEKKRKELLLKRGCREFHFSYRISETLVKEMTIIALNKKSAKKKYDRVIKLWKESV